jgi:hypothetical protein
VDLEADLGVIATRLYLVVEVLDWCHCLVEGLD